MPNSVFAWPLVSLLAVSLAAACGDSTSDDGRAGNAGNAGSAGSGGSGGATGGSGGSVAGAAGASGSAGAAVDGGDYLKCFDENGKLTNYDLKTCTGDTCAILVHQTDCCGNTLLIGVESGKLAELQACEAAWAATLPACGCPAGPPEIEQPAGTSVSDPSAADVVCGNWTMSSGICITQPKNVDAG